MQTGGVLLPSGTAVAVDRKTFKNPTIRSRNPNRAKPHSATHLAPSAPTLEPWTPFALADALVTDGIFLRCVERLRGSCVIPFRPRASEMLPRKSLTFGRRRAL